LPLPGPTPLLLGGLLLLLLLSLLAAPPPPPVGAPALLPPPRPCRDFSASCLAKPSTASWAPASTAALTTQVVASTCACSSKRHHATRRGVR
jgi:hypothetical protein